MPAYPVEILNFGNPEFKTHEMIIEELNQLQGDVLYGVPRPPYRNWAAPFERDAYSEGFVYEKIEEYRKHCKGFHPFVIALVHGALNSDKGKELFGSHEAERGVAVVTSKDWEAPPSISAFLTYHFVRYTLSFVCPDAKTHDAIGGCLFDRKLTKDALKPALYSARICSQCRSLYEESVDPFSYESLRKLVAYAKDKANGEVPKRPAIFIGSSKEGLKTARYLQLGLEHAAECTIWSQGLFGLSHGTLEDLVRACKKFQYAILVLTPDDLTVKRGKEGNAPRDNVLFELGLFMGALGRERTFMVRCSDETIDLPTDLAGVQAATYSRRDDNLEAAIGGVCTRIEQALGIM
jgi:predicted nucleotide-binding protein